MLDNELSSLLPEFDKVPVRQDETRTLTPQGKKRQRKNLHPLTPAQRREHSQHTPRMPADPNNINLSD